MVKDVNAQRFEFARICRTYIHREGLEDLLAWLEDGEKSDFFTSPASTRTSFHGAYEGGLCEHSLDVFKIAMARADSFFPEKSGETEEQRAERHEKFIESVAIAALFHDLCKIGCYVPKARAFGDYKYEKCDGLNIGHHGATSVFLISRHMRLTMGEWAAIVCHMGVYDISGSAASEISSAYDRIPLALLIHQADEEAAHLKDR